MAFVQRLTRLRREDPVLCRPRSLTAARNDDLKVGDVTWLAPAGSEMYSEQWDELRTLCFSMLLEGKARGSGIVRPGAEKSVRLVFDAWLDVVESTLPGAGRKLPLETAFLHQDSRRARDAAFAAGTAYRVTGRSLLALTAVEV